MWKCPYCNARMKHPGPEHVPMSARRMEIYKFIAEAGPEGIPREYVLFKFFGGVAETTMRTTLFNINSVIRPARIHTQGGVIRLVRSDQ